MTRHKKSKQLSPAEIERFVNDAERLHKTLVRPLISPSSDHYRASVKLNQALLKAVEEVTGKPAPFVRWNSTGPAKVA
ncbi:hypothetical protein NKH37_11265 [Mesorhizobium sp. M1217]|uniref:hypothetical protein n=1 Tax=Mesorhizobium sp. M1217 TaxID=2957070 RepID=UPI0033376FD8